MIEQQGNALRFRAFYTASGVGATGISVTVDVHRNLTEVVTGASAIEYADGLYYYDLADASVNAEGEYVAVFKTADVTVDQKHIAAVWAVGKAGVEKLVNATDAVGLANDAITDAKFDELTAFPLKSADTGSTQIARATATLDAISGLASTLATIQGYVDDLETRLTSARAGYLDKLNVSGTLAHSDAADLYKADVPTESEIAGVVLSSAVEDSLSLIQALRLMLAALSGQSAGVGTTTERYKSVDGTKDRLVVTFDQDANRLTVTRDGS